MALTDKLKAIADGFRERDNTTAELSLTEMALLARKGGGYIEDIPTTQGQWACLARASQMCDITYTPKADMYSSGSDSWEFMQAGTEYKGIIYSSVRALDWGFIGYGVSMYSYLTALNNPKSVIYTEKYGDYFVSDGSSAYANVYNVYGTNCSEFASYCFNLPYLLTTVRLWNDCPYLVDDNGRNDIYFQDKYYNTYRCGKCCDANGVVDTEALQTKLKLCDVMVCTNHTVMVTGIRRDEEGLVREVDISESTMPRIKKTTYTWKEFVEEFIDINTAKYPYQVFEYTKLESVVFPENLHDIVYSDIVTNRGDKICIRPDMGIALNVLNANDYVGIALFKDGVLMNTQASTADWELSNLTTGKYTAVLYKADETVTVEDANETNSTSFIVCAVSLTRSGNTYHYTAEAVNGVYPTPMQVTLKTEIGMTDQYESIENDSFAGTGSIEVIPRVTPSIIHLPFKTEYGFVIAECTFD